MLASGSRQIVAKDETLKHAVSVMFSTFSDALDQCRCYGGHGGRAPPNDCLCSLISIYSKCVVGTSRNGRTTGNNGRRNNNVQTYFSFDVFPILREIFGHQLQYKHEMQ